ncbi:MAG: hypothetical protein HY062_18565, partial [Bacteroidetes bacterium]|nr:hypothetical protein [Bacteroidota bacterium]
MKKVILLMVFLVGVLSIMHSQPVNLEFNSGTLNGWTLQEGGNQSSVAKLISNIHASSEYTIFPGSMTEINGTPIATVSPLGGNFVRIGQTGTGGNTYKLSQTFTVDPSSTALSFAYAMVLDNGDHICDEQNYFDFALKDSGGNLIPANSNSQSLLNGNACSGGDPSYSTYSHFGYKNWNLSSYDLTGYIGTSVTVEVLVSGCSMYQAAHPGYAYFDAAVCSNANAQQSVIVNGISYLLTQSNQTIDLCNTTAAVISAPSGASSYSWSGGALNGITTQSVSITQPGVYHLSYNSPFACSNTTEVNFRIGMSPTLSIISSTNSACPGVSRTLTASGASSYVWTTVSGTSNSAGFLPDYSIAPQVTSVYNVVGKDTYGCTASLNYTAVVSPTPSLSVSGSTLSCTPGSSVSLTALGADSYTWTSGVTTNSIIVTPTVNSNYSVTGALLSSGCKSTYVHYINVGTNISVTTSKNNFCVGSLDSAVVTGSGATSYTWSTGATTNPVTLSPTITTVYTLNGMTDCGIRQATFMLTVNPLPSIPISITPPICSGGTNIYSTTSGLSSYTWNTGATAYYGFITPVNTGSSYTMNLSLTAKSLAGCTNTNSLTYTVNPKPNITLSLSNGICLGDTSLITATGASSYTWNPGNLIGSSIISPSVSTNYTVSGTSSFGCINTQTIGVGISPSSSLTAFANPSITCAGKTTSLSVQGNGLMRWYISDTTSQYVSNGLSYVTPTLSIGTYTYYVSSSCSGYSTRVPVVFTVAANPTLGIVANTSSVCANVPFQLVANGATTYTWSSGYPSYITVLNDTITTSQASASVYTIKGADINGCVSTNTISINMYPTSQVTVTANPSDICVGSSSTLSLIGATSYTWSNGVVSSPAVVTPTAYTSYSVNLINTYGCLQQNYVYLNILQRPTLTFAASTNSLCAGSSQTIVASGAATYTWSSGITTASISVSPTVTTSYSVTGSASGLPGCSSTAVKTITVYALPNVQITSNKDTLCYGSALTMTATGAYSYLWNDGSTSNTYNVNLNVPTTYTVTGTGLSGCKSTYTKSIGVYSIIQVTAVATPSAVCYGQTTTISGVGVPNYTVAGYGAPYNTPKVVFPQWTPPNTYVVSGIDGHGCASSSNVTVPTDRSAYFYTGVNSGTYSSTVCAGSNVSIAASTPSLSYVWSPGGSTASSVTVTPLATTIYTVTGSSATCSYVNTVLITAKPSPTVSVISSGTLTCAAQPTLYATASNSVTYVWCYLNGGFLNSTGVTTNSFVAYTSLSYSCYVTSTTNSCVSIATASFAIDNNNPTVTYTVPNSVCPGAPAQILAGGANLYNLNYTGMTTNNVFVVSPSATTTYTLVGVGSNSCAVAVYPQVVVGTNPTVSVSSSAPVCEGSSANILASGATTYVWNTGEITPGITVSPSVTTTYSVTGTDSNNCSSTQTVSVLIDNTCADVWPGDANSDGVANNLDVLELGLHYTQTGTPRASISNTWQSYFSNNWSGTIT